MATAIPSTVISTTNLDASTDSVASARADILALTVAYNQLIVAMVGGSKMYSDENQGAGSGLDADKLDGQQGAYYQSSSNQNTGTLPLDRLPSTLTGKSADQLNGQSGSYYQNADNLNGGTVPVARLPEGSLTAKGILELATTIEAQAGSDATRAVTPSGLDYALSQRFLKSGTLSSGNQVLDSGIIIQWGSVDVGDVFQTIVPITFSTTFNEVYHVFTGVKSNTGLYSGIDAATMPAVITLSNSGASLSSHEFAAVVQDLTVTYFAIGV